MSYPAIRGSDVFLKEDLRAIMQSILLTNEAATRALGGSADYRAGFMAALLAMATGINCSLDLRGYRSSSWEEQR